MTDKDKNLEKIINSIKESLEAIPPLLPGVEKEVDQIIEFLQEHKVEYLIKKESKNPKDVQYIKEFDNKVEYELDFLNNPFVEKYFFKALYYWGELNKESAKYYKESFKDLYGDDTDLE